MTAYLLYALAWLLLSFAVFKLLGPIAVVVYGFVSIGGLLIYAATRKRQEHDDSV